MHFYWIQIYKWQTEVLSDYPIIDYLLEVVFVDKSGSLSIGFFILSFVNTYHLLSIDHLYTFWPLWTIDVSWWLLAPFTCPFFIFNSIWLSISHCLLILVINCEFIPFVSIEQFI
jgi:hypothetical protein